MRKYILTLFVVFLSLFPETLSAQTDSTYQFRFVPKKDMFFVPYGENRTELVRLTLFIRQNRTVIAEGRLPLYVDGYCSSRQGIMENMATARMRSSRVKSELILHSGMREEYFVTRNHTEGGDYVTVKVTLPSTTASDAFATVSDTLRHAERSEVSTSPETQGEEILHSEQKDDGTRNDSGIQHDSYIQDNGSAFSLRLNLLRWATLTPDLGIEWRINRNIGVLVNGSWTSWSWDNKNRKYALWEVSPEVRYYIGKEKRGYLGAMYKAGEFNYKLSKTGKQGDLMGGGITGGYQLRLNKALALDFSLGIGYLRADYDRYTVLDGVKVKQGSESKNWWGPVSAGVSLMWKPF